MTTWIEALKKWNGKRGGKYMIPRKGTEEHAQVMSIMKGQQNGKGIVQLGKRAKKELDDNVDLYQRTKKNVREANRTYEATKPLQKQTINNIKRVNSKIDKYGSIFGGSLEKAVSFATQNPEKFVEIVNQQQSGSGMKQQVGGFLPAFIIPFIPAITTALGAFATGAAGAAGAAVVDEIVGGEVINPNVDIISEINNLLKGLTGSGMTAPQKSKLKKRINGGMIDLRDLSVVSRMSRDITKKAKQKGGNNPSWAEVSLANEFLYPLQPKLPSLDTRTGRPVPPSTPFDFLNIKF